MDPSFIGLVVFACTLGGALLGNWLSGRLPPHHLDEKSRDTMMAGIGLIATMSALVLGLVTASARSSFDAMDVAVRHTAMDVLTLDRLLARYGPETAEIRAALAHAMTIRVDAIWLEGSAARARVDPIESGTAAGGERLADMVLQLVPRDDFQRSIQRTAAELAEEILQTRWMMTTRGVSSVPLPFLIVLVFWLTITFASFGLFAPRNATVLAVLFVCALSVGSAVFLILELDGPFEGVLKVARAPFDYSIARLGR